MSHKSEYTMSAQELIQETIRLRALEKQFTKERGELMQEVLMLKGEIKRYSEVVVRGLLDRNGELMARVRELEFADNLNQSVIEDRYKMRAEAAEARVREMEEIRHRDLDAVKLLGENWAKDQARLAAVLGALKPFSDYAKLHGCATVVGRNGAVIPQSAWSLAIGLSEDAIRAQ